MSSPSSAASTATPSRSTRRGSLGAKTAPSIQRFPSVGVQLDRDEAGEVPRARTLRFNHLDAPLFSDRPSVDEGDGRRQDGSKQTHEHGAHEQGMAFTGQFAVIPHPHALDSVVIDLCQDAPQALRQRDEGLEPLEFFRGHRREVHRVPNHARPEKISHTGCCLDTDELLCLFGGGRDVRSRHHTGKSGQYCGRRGLDLEHVQSGAGHVTLPEGFGERVFINQVAAGRVDDLDTPLAPGKLVAPDQRTVAWRGGDVERNEVGTLTQVVERYEVDIEVGSDLSRDKRVVGDQPHLEGPRPSSYFPADPAKTDDPERLAPYFSALQRLLLPAPFLHLRVGQGDRPRHREHQRTGVLGHADAVSPRCVDDEDAPLACGVQVDVVDTSTGTSHHLQPRRRRDQ